MSWERAFQIPKENIDETRIPELTQSEAAGFRLQTEERVSRKIGIENEARERNEADIKLREEMHTFGMISCGFFDADTKIVTFTPNKRQSVNVPCIVQSGETWSPVKSTEACLLEKGTTYSFTPNKIIIDVGMVSGIVASGQIAEDGETYNAILTVTRGAVNSGTVAVAALSLSLAGAIYKTNAMRFPVPGESVAVNVNINCLNFFK